MDNRRTNLKDYFKVIKTCKKCSLIYGIDGNKENEKGKGVCPECLSVVKRKFYLVGTKEQGGNTL